MISAIERWKGPLTWYDNDANGLVCLKTFKVIVNNVSAVHWLKHIPNQRPEWVFCWLQDLMKFLLMILHVLKLQLIIVNVF